MGLFGGERVFAIVCVADVRKQDGGESTSAARRVLVLSSYFFFS